MDKKLRNKYLIFFIIGSILLVIILYYYRDVKSFIYFGFITLLVLCIGLLVFTIKGPLPRKTFYILVVHFLFVSVVSLFSIFITLEIFIKVFDNTILGFNIALTTGFLLSVFFVFILHKFIRRYFITENYLDSQSLSILTNVANFSTFLITVILLFNSTISTELSNNKIKQLESSLNNVITQLGKPDITSDNLVFQNSVLVQQENKQIDISSYSIALYAMTVYVLASFYTLLPILDRRRNISGRRIPDTEIPPAINIIERAEIEILIKMKHNHINSYNQKEK